MERFGGTIVLHAANRWDDMWMADQQLAMSLSKIAPVLYVDPVQSAATRIRANGWRGLARNRARLRLQTPALARLEPEGLPGLSRPGIAPVNSRLAAIQVRRALAMLRATARVSIEANVLAPVSGQLGERTKVYWAQDDFEAMAELIGGPAKAYAKANARLAAEADVVVAANPRVADALRLRGRDAHVIPFGCDAAHFASAAQSDLSPEVHLEKPFAVFMGHVGERIDLSLLEGLVGAGIRLLLVGPLHPRANRDRFEALAALTSVQWLGGRPFDELPVYLSGAEVGLVPYTASKFNLSSFPLKTLEYLAAGLPVVSTPLPGVEWIQSEDIHVAAGSTDFVREVAALIRRGRDAPGDERRRAFATTHSWDARAASMAAVLGIEGGHHA